MQQKMIFRLLALLTLVVLALSFPLINLAYTGQALLFALMAAALSYFSILLLEGEISTVFLLGILSILLLPSEAQAIVLWALCLGAAVGGLLRSRLYRLNPPYHQSASPWHTMVTVAASISLSFVAAQTVYSLSGGKQPWLAIAMTDLVPVTAMVIAQVLVFGLIFLLGGFTVWPSLRSVLADNRLLLLTVLVVPAPIIALSAGPVADKPVVALLLLAAELLGINGILYIASRIRFHRWRQRLGLRTLTHISQAIYANQDLNSLLKTVYDELVGLLHIDYFTVALLRDDEVIFPLVVRQGKAMQSDVPVQRPVNTLLDRVLETEQALLIGSDAMKQTRRMGLLPPDDHLSAWMGVPLLAAGRLLGALVIGSRDPRLRFSQEELYVLNIIAAATSVNIDNTQLYTQQTERAGKLANLNTVLALLTETLSPDGVLDTLISSATAISEARAVALYRFYGGNFRLVRSAGLNEDFEVDPILVMSEPDDPQEADLPVLVENVSEDERALHLRDAVLREGMNAWIELPLVVSGHGIGAIVLYYDRVQRFTPEHIEHLRSFANQAAQAIQNADLYAGTYQALELHLEQLSVLARLGRELMTTMDQTVIAELLLRYTLDAVSSETGAVLLRDDSQSNFVLMAQQGYPNRAFADPAILTQGLTGRALHKGEILRSNDVSSESDYVALVGETLSQLTVPLMWQGEVIGAVTLEGRRSDQFAIEDTNFVVQIVNQVLVAIENARLFRDAAERRDRVQAILNTMTEALILIDRHQRLAMANPRVSLLGVDSDQLVGAHLGELLNDPRLNFAECLGFQSENELLLALRDPRRVDESWIYSLSMPGKPPLHIQRQIIPVEDEQGDLIGILLAFHDETARYNLDRAREEFSQMIIHDLRSPLTAVTSSVMLLNEVIPPDNEFSTLVSQTAGSSQRAIRKLLNRVDSLLDISRMKSGAMTLQLEAAMLGPLLRNVQTELAPLAQTTDIEIRACLSDDEPMLLIDTEKVERVLMNLVDNALKFSPRESEITIRTGALYGSSDQPLLRIDVIDQGPGVPESERQSIFDRFVQIQQSGGSQRRGSGLGLNFCKLVVEAHRGSIWIEENPEGGSIFAFTLPLFTGDNPPAPDEH